MTSVKMVVRRPPTLVRRVLTLLLIVCLVECASGSCLSYGHSCWGAHGKRSGKPPSAAPDWYLTRLLRRITTNESENKRAQRDNGELTAIFPAAEGADDEQNTNKIDEQTQEYVQNRQGPGIPMLDDEPLSNKKIWQIMKAAAMYDN